MSAVPAVASIAMVPMTPLPGPAGTGMIPVPFMPGIPAATPNPVSVDPDIIRTGSDRAGVNDIIRLRFDIAIDCATGESAKTGYCNDY